MSPSADVLGLLSLEPGGGELILRGVVLTGYTFAVGRVSEDASAATILVPAVTKLILPLTFYLAGTLILEVGTLVYLSDSSVL